jgi:hypothetical protein
MKKPTLLYIPLVILFAFSIAVLAAHYYRIFELQTVAGREADFPFGYFGTVTSVSPEAERGGIKSGDRIEAINGRLFTDDSAYTEELVKLRGASARRAFDVEKNGGRTNRAIRNKGAARCHRA